MTGSGEAPRQRGLFGDLEPAPAARAGVQPAAAGAEHVQLAARLPRGLRLGTSSWSFPGWTGLVYAPGAPQRHLARDGLAAYARHPLLRAVGIDRTFYAPLEAEAFGAYADAVPDDFRFLVKAWAECTTDPATARPRARPQPAGAGGAHYLDAAFAADTVIAPALAGLGDKLAVLVFQFPPQGRAWLRAPQAFAERLGGFLAALPRGPRYAVELRDRELLTVDYAAALAATGAQHCFTVHPRMPAIERQRELFDVAGHVTVRWMLQPPLGYRQAKERFAPFDALRSPDPVRRGAIAALCADALVKGGDVTVVINNKAEGSAPRSAFALAELLAERLERGR